MGRPNGTFTQLERVSVFFYNLYHAELVSASVLFKNAQVSYFCILLFIKNERISLAELRFAHEC